MSYTTGIASTAADLIAAIVAAAESVGYAGMGGNDGPILVKNGCYFQLAPFSALGTSDGVSILGGTGTDSGALTGTAPRKLVCSGGNVLSRLRPTVWPLTWHIFAFDDASQEVYCVIHYNVTDIQWLAFGKSAQPGLSGGGAWFGASDVPNGGTADLSFPDQSAVWGGSYSYTNVSLFSSCGNGIGGASAGNTYCHHDLDGGGWGNTGNNSNAQHDRSLLAYQPNGYNGEAVLLPIRAYIGRPENYRSIICTPWHCRELRIDNYALGEVITLGSEQWMVFPWWLKGPTREPPYERINTGTYGFAVRRQ